MKLKAALDIAAGYTDLKADHANLHVVVLRDGCVRATDQISGCQIPCDDVDGINLAVDCKALRKMVSAIGKDVTLKKAKGRKLVVSGPGVEYKIKAIPAKDEPEFPDIPDDKAAWAEVTADQIKAIASIADLIDPKGSVTNAAFLGVRIGTDWCAAATNQMMAFAWVPGLVDEGFTVPPAVFDGLASKVDLLVGEDNRLYVRTESEQVRWSLGLSGDWPEASLNKALVYGRDQDRHVAKVNLDDIALLASQAEVVAESKAHAFKLTLEAGGLVFEGDRDRADFQGRSDIDDYEAAKKAGGHVGIEPSRLSLLCGVVAAVGGDAYLSVAGPVQPVMIWNSEAETIIETLTMPMRLE